MYIYMYSVCVRAREMTRHLLLLQRTQVWFLTLVPGVLSLPISAAPGDPMPPSDLSRYLISCAHTQTHTHAHK